MRNIYIIVFLFVSYSTFSQSNDSIFSKFDLEKYINLKEKNVNHYFLEDSTKITYSEDGSMYQIVLSESKSHFSYVYQYFKATLTLKSSVRYFQRNSVELYSEYNEKGTLIKENKPDSLFIFSLQELHEKLIDEYNLDFMDVDRAIGVSMETIIRPVYNIAYNTTSNRFGTWRFLQFDGLTGDVITDFEKKTDCKAK